MLCLNSCVDTLVIFNRPAKLLWDACHRRDKEGNKDCSLFLYNHLANCNISSLTSFAHLHLSADNTANILTRRGGFSRREMSMYFLPVVISDNDYPIQSSTSTLIVRVCACDSRGNMQSCSPEVLPFSDGLTTGALVAILLCVIILLSKSPRV